MSVREILSLAAPPKPELGEEAKKRLPSRNYVLRTRLRALPLRTCVFFAVARARSLLARCRRARHCSDPAATCLPLDGLARLALGLELARGLEPVTCGLQIRRSTN